MCSNELGSQGYNQQADLNFLSKIKGRYHLAFGAIVIISMMSQAFIQFHISKQSGFAEIINISGRQRFLSARYVYEGLRHLNRDVSVTDPLMGSTLEQVKSGHHKLISFKGNTADISRRLATLFPTLNKMEQLKSCIVSKTCYESHDLKSLKKEIHDAQTHFFRSMDDITFLYQQRSSYLSNILRSLEILLFAIMLIILAFEVNLIFDPSLTYIKKNIEKILSIHEKIDKEKMLWQDQLLKKEADTLRTMVATYSHEINTPLCVALHCMGKMKQNVNYEENFKDVDESLRKIKQIMKKINQIDGDEVVYSRYSGSEDSIIDLYAGKKPN